MQAANQNLKHRYAVVSATGSIFIAEQRDRLDAGEMRRAQAADAAEPQAFAAYRQILKVHGYVRAQLNEIRRARHAQGKHLSLRGLAIVDHFTQSGWIISRPRFDVYEAEQMQLVASTRDGFAPQAFKQHSLTNGGFYVSFQENARAFCPRLPMARKIAANHQDISKT